MKNPNIVFIVCLVFGAACCKDKFIDPFKQPDPVLPPITSEGKNTFGCMVNGVLFLPNQYKDKARCEYYSWHSSPQIYGTLSILGSKDQFMDGKSASTSFKLANRVFGKGKHFLYSTGNNKNQLFYRFDTDFFYDKVQDTNNVMFISRLDTVNRIVSGTFQYTVINQDNSLDTIRVTDGRFDFKY